VNNLQFYSIIGHAVIELCCLTPAFCIVTFVYGNFILPVNTDVRVTWLYFEMFGPKLINLFSFSCAVI